MWTQICKLNSPLYPTVSTLPWFFFFFGLGYWVPFLLHFFSVEIYALVFTTQNKFHESPSGIVYTRIIPEHDVTIIRISVMICTDSHSCRHNVLLLLLLKARTRKRYNNDANTKAIAKNIIFYIFRTNYYCTSKFFLQKL